MSKHSPLPWIAKEVGECRAGKLYEIRDDDNEAVAEQVMERDVPLLTAAPELLACLVDIAADFDSASYASEATLAKIQAAIDKAEGQP